MIGTRLAVAGICSVLLTPFSLSAGVGSIELGIEQFEAGDLAAARQTLEGALAEEPARHLALAYLGRIALAESELDEAIGHLKDAVELERSNSMYRTWLGRAYIDKLQTVSFFEKGVLSGRALEALQKAVELDATNIEARVSLAGYYLNAPALAGGSVRKAREQAEAIVALDPARGNFTLARIHMRDEEYDLALEKLDQCIEARPDDLDCRFQLAMLHQQLEQYDLAFEALERVLEQSPGGRGALYQIGRTAAFSGTRVDRGIECLEEYLALDERPGYPGHDGAHWRLGMLFEHRGDAMRAKAEYETAVRLNPDEKMYRESLQKLGGS